MEEKDKIIQLDDPLDEEIIELKDEVSDVPDDEEIIEISDFADTSPTESENILDLTEKDDTSSDEDDDIIDLTDTVEDYTEKDEEVLEINDVIGEPSLKEEEILEIDDFEGESPAEDEEISETVYVTEEPAVDEEKISELYKTVEKPAEPEKKAIEQPDLAVETPFEEEIEDIVEDIPAEDEDIIKSTELGSKTDSPGLYDSNDDDSSADLDSEIEEETIVIDELDSDDLDGEINIEFDNQSLAETNDFSPSEALSMNEEPTVLLDEEPVKEEEPVEPEIKAFEQQDLAAETSFEEEIEDIVDDAPAEDEDIIKSVEIGSETDRSGFSDSNDDDLSADLDSESDEETIELDELDSDDLDGDINIEFDDPLSAETAEFSSSEALPLNEEPLKEEELIEAEDISQDMETDLEFDQEDDFMELQQEDLEPEVETLPTEKYDQESDASLQEDLGTKDYVIDPESISSEMIEEAVEKVVRKMYSEKIESVLVDVIEKRVSSEIERLKILLLEDTTGDE